MSGVWNSLTLLFLGCAVFACTGKGDKTSSANGQGVADRRTNYVSGLTIISPAKNTKYKSGEHIAIKCANSYSHNADSVLVYNNGQLIQTLYGNSFQHIVDAPEKVGRHSFRIEAHYSDSTIGVATAMVYVLPDAPKKLEYKIIAQYPHNKNSFTQGLLFYNGNLYEGTGGYGTSLLQKIDLLTGSVVQEKMLSNKYFGEGIALIDNKIYQLTWLEHRCLVYSQETFEQIDEFAYDGQGWGLTSRDGELIFSDGSNMLYILNPNSFLLLNTVSVFDNMGEVVRLNELEYINGLVWANIWQSDRIVAIDLKSGAVVYELDLSKLLSAQERAALSDSADDVLNGIAYNPKTGHLYLTGKRWPKLFEIKLLNL